MKRIISFLVVAAMLVFIFPIISNAASTLYVGPGQAYTAIMDAYAAAASGDTIIVKDGTYYETASPASWGIIELNKANITLRAEHKWGAIIDAQNSTSREVCVYFSANNNVLDGFVVRNGAYGGIMNYGSNSKILNCKIYNNGSVERSRTNGQAGIYASQSTYGGIITGNYIYGNGRPVSSSYDQFDHGIYDGGDNVLISNNVIAGNSSYGIQIAGYDNDSGTKIYNNTIAGNGRSGIMVWDGDGGYVTNLEIKNNILDGNGQRWQGSGCAYGVDFYGIVSHITGTVISYNLFNGNTDGNIEAGYSYTGSNNTNGVPGFVSGSTPYCITGASPAYNAGTSVTGVPKDFDENSRPQGAAFDIGAYEVSAPAGNLLANPGFESGVANWANGSWGTYTTDTANKRTGTYCLKVTGASGGVGQDVTSGFTVGQNVTVSGYAKRSGGTVTAYLEMNFYNGSTFISVQTVSTKATSYTLLSATAAVPANTTKIRVMAWTDGGGAGDTGYFDDIDLRK